MKNTSNDASCAKLLLKKSSGHLKISLIMFFVSITITSIIGLLYARQYFQYEKDFLENVAVRTVYVESVFDNDTVQPVSTEDVEKIGRTLKEKFPKEKLDIIPVYSCMGISINGEILNLFAIDHDFAFFLGLDEMQDGTAYFTHKQPSKVALEISVTKEIDGNFYSDKLKRVILDTDFGVSEKTPVLSSQNKYFTPSMFENQMCFVTVNTFYDIVSVLLEKEVSDISDVANSNLVSLTGIYVYLDNLSLVSDMSSFLTEQNYRAYAPVDAFDDFGETVSVTFLVFLLSSFVLLFMTTVNIFLSFRSFYRVQQKDMGVLRYMGFDNKRIFRMYCKNLSKKFLQIFVIAALIIFVLGMLLFSFEHWLVLSAFILSLFVFLSLIFLAISRFIIHKYIRQDLLTLIRESKEFE